MLLKISWIKWLTMKITKVWFLTVAPFEYADLDELLDKFDQEGKEPFILMLDSIEDPHNLGSILRTCDATGVDAVIIPKKKSKWFNFCCCQNFNGCN